MLVFRVGLKFFSGYVTLNQRKEPLLLKRGTIFVFRRITTSTRVVATLYNTKTTLRLFEKNGV
ncbi:hypothetical protein NHP190012_12270 [Helicobacter sp. NHP19-012]|uniref:Uncharacterized protein n=1 Tax=Helicobacter gastrofelis TaxID=2849642 RepID=A0ABN6ID44_9HELI|nr:hypothetical protein NHP190012_12270 [Helicobacter sp. NHP19-012]GMB96748.1 hypothetical protein NHP22001_13370 [Helicobacter sp. NHP22-001]